MDSVSIIVWSTITEKQLSVGFARDYRFRASPSNAIEVDSSIKLVVVACSVKIFHQLP
jgi:hypothetical protein